MEKSIQMAKNAINNYFETVGLEKGVVIGEITKSNEFRDNILEEYTGLIGLSGEFEGGMYVTCSEGFLKCLFKALMHEDPKPPYKALFSDLVGEISNTISGYFQKEYGEKFYISVPYSIIGNSEISMLRKQLSFTFFLIPFSYEGHGGALGFSIINKIR